MALGVDAAVGLLAGVELAALVRVAVVVPLAGANLYIRGRVRTLQGPITYIARTIVIEYFANCSVNEKLLIKGPHLGCIRPC